MDIVLEFDDEGVLVNTATGELVVCHWFAGCLRAATGLTPHPVYGDIPTCARCHKFATGEDR